jgi:hypothetical protein
MTETAVVFRGAFGFVAWFDDKAIGPEDCSIIKLRELPGTAADSPIDL